MNADRVLALVLLAGSAVYLGVLVPQVGAAQTALGSGDFYTVGPTALPIFAGAMMALFSLAALAMAPRTAPEVPFRDGLFRAAAFALIAALATVLLPHIGFLPAAMAFLAAVFVVFRAASWWIATVLTLVLPVLLDQVLRKVFLVPLPGGALF